MVCGSQIDEKIAELTQHFDLKQYVTNLVEDKTATSQMNSECVQKLSQYVNNFETYQTEIAMLLLYSGRDINDLGRYRD